MDKSYLIFCSRWAKRYKNLLSICLALSFLFVHFSPAYADIVDKQYNNAKKYYTDLVSDKNRVKARHNWLRGIKNFKSIYRKYPDHRRASACLFMLGRMYRDMYSWSNNPLDIGESIAYYEDVATLFSKDRLADDSLYVLGMIYLKDKNDIKKAAKNFAKIVALYPDGDMSQTAAAQLRKLNGSLGTTTDDKVEQLFASTKKEPADVTGAELREIRHLSNNVYTRVVIETTSRVRYQDYLLEENEAMPKRLYIDFSDCVLPPGFDENIPIQDGLLKQVRTAQYSPTNVRVVLDTESIDDYKIFSLTNPFRVVIDVSGNNNETRKNIKTTSISRPGLPSLAQQLGLGIKRIIIDPGHGGKDVGAVSPSGLFEKDIVLKVAKKTAKLLKQELNCEVLLTRNSDVFLKLETRTGIANSSNGDLFISIHANSAPTNDAKGIETYILDLPSSNDAKQVAARENSSSESQLSDLEMILSDLLQNTKITESAKLAELVQESIVEGVNKNYLGVNNLGVKRAPFIVLIGARMPAILTEIAFLSNPEEEKRLRSETYLNTIAMQIVDGVARYNSSLDYANLR